MDIKKILGKRIQEIRKSTNYTQEKLAELIGIETVSLSNIERGKYYPSAENLNKIMEVLKITPSELFMMEHHASHLEMLDELYSKMKSDKELTSLIYKFYQVIKFMY